jgi:hypothetical protein
MMRTTTNSYTLTLHCCVLLGLQSRVVTFRDEAFTKLNDASSNLAEVEKTLQQV